METVVTVIGVNGDRVVLSGEDVGADGIWLASKLDGFYDPEIKTVTKRRANRPGTKFISHRILERTIIFKVTIDNGEGPGKTWEELDARWRKLWAYDRYSTIQVTTINGSRQLKARLEEIEVDMDYDPHTNGATDVMMTVVADDPFWYAEELIIDLVVNGTATLSIPSANPTGNPIFPVWVLEAPGTWEIPDYDTSVTPHDPKMVPLPTLNIGEHTEVNTDPAERQLISQNKTPIWARMNGVRFRNPIQPYTEKINYTINVTATGPRKAQLRLPRPFNRPWGLV